jgi:hypothetical protein
VLTVASDVNSRPLAEVRLKTGYPSASRPIGGDQRGALRDIFTVVTPSGTIQSGGKYRKVPLTFILITLEEAKELLPKSLTGKLSKVIELAAYKLTNSASVASSVNVIPEVDSSITSLRCYDKVTSVEKRCG